MASGSRGWTDEQVEQFIGNLLRVGVLTAALVTTAGGILYLAAHHGDPPPDLSHFGTGAPEELRSPSGVVRDTLAGSRRGLIQLGLLLLIATPVARVVFSVFAFYRQRDYGYVAVTVIVLAVLLFSIFVYPHLPGAAPR